MLGIQPAQVPWTAPASNISLGNGRTGAVPCNEPEEAPKHSGRAGQAEDLSEAGIGHGNDSDADVVPKVDIVGLGVAALLQEVH